MSSKWLLAVAVIHLAVGGCSDPTVPGTVRIEITRDTATLLPNDSVALSALVFDSDGTPISNPVITWSSSDSLVAAVRPSGWVVARSTGSAIISAHTGSTSDSVRITVLSALDCSTAQSRAIGTETWRAAETPHLIVDTMVVTGILTIEPGARVYACTKAVLAAAGGQIVAVGTSAQPVTFKPADPARGWGGIHAGLSLNFAGGTVVLKFAKIEDASIESNFGSLTLEDSWLRNSDVSGSSMHIRRTVVDSGDVVLVGGSFEESVIRAGSLLLGRSSFPFGPIQIDGGRIENSPGIALTTDARVRGSGPSVTSTRPLRIVGSRGHPVDVPLQIFRTIWPTRQAQDSLLGNLNDTLLIGAGGSGNGIVRRELPWKLTCYLPCGGFPLDTLTVEPGGSIRLDVSLIVRQLSAVGTMGSPIRFSGAGSGIVLQGTGQSEIRHAILSGAYLSAREQHAVTLAHITARNYISLASAGSSIRDSEISDVVGPANTSVIPVAALALSANGARAERIVVRRTTGVNGGANLTPLAGISISASNVEVQQCEVTDNASDGVRISAGANIRINDCNIERNGGFGVNNTGTASVNARRNWWGDPAGPFGPGADRVSGDVDYAEWLASPRPALRPGTSIGGGVLQRGKRQVP